jgi:hypothetical protein
VGFQETRHDPRSGEHIEDSKTLLAKSAFDAIDGLCDIVQQQPFVADVSKQLTGKEIRILA